MLNILNNETARLQWGGLLQAPSAGSGQSECVVSCVRLRRNIAGFNFPGRCEPSQLFDVAAYVLSRMEKNPLWRGFDYRIVRDLDCMSRELLVEKQIISPSLAEGLPGSICALDNGGRASCMINEDDHVVVTVHMPGFSLEKAYMTASRLLESLELQYVTDPVLGYLTADPSCAGTGMQAFVLVHLPATDYVLGTSGATIDMDRKWPLVEMKSLEIGGGCKCSALWTVQNRVTLSVLPEATVDAIGEAACILAAKEKSTMQQLKTRDGDMLKDRLWRTWGTLRHARRLDLNEAQGYLSLVTLGSEMGYLPHIPKDEWFRLYIDSQPYHLRAEAGKDIDEPGVFSLRADLFRRFIEERSAHNKEL